MSKELADEMAQIVAMAVDLANRADRARQAALRLCSPDNTASPLPVVKCKWVTIAAAAHELQVSETTAWRHACRIGANWPETGIRWVDMIKLRAVRPPRD